MKLFIAEKPQLARDIAGVIGNPRKNRGYIECSGDNVVTWCLGHLFVDLKPDEYDADLSWKNYSVENLPFMPDKWEIKPRSDAGVKAQLSIIKKLLKKCDLVVNAGDPDREGQLLVDEVLVEANYAGTVKRIWHNSQDPAGLKKALAELLDNEERKPLYLSALARKRADWLLGMNLTMAYTWYARKNGYSGVVPVGRVQTPTLSLVVKRNEEIENFVPIEHYFLGASFAKEEGQSFKGKMVPQKNELDENGLFTDRGKIDTIFISLKKISSANVEKYEKTPVEKKAPLPFSLSDLQVVTSRKWKMSSKDVLDTVQSLYERHKLLSYPRTDCRYLATGQLEDAEKILSNLVDLDLNNEVPVEYTDVPPRPGFFVRTVLLYRRWFGRSIIAIARIPFRFQPCARIAMFDGGYSAPPCEKKRFNEM